MWRRIWRAVLPALTVALLFGGIFASLSFGAWQHYRQESNAELASLIGVLAQQSPELNVADLIHALQNGDPTANATGAEILQTYGYAATDFAAASAQTYGLVLVSIGLAAVLCVGLALAGYLYYHDFRARQQILGLVEYVQKLNDHIYDLQIESNTEAELSLLSNELYKITVTLKETAEYDRRVRRELETALADISHQLKTPLTSLQIALDNLLADPDMPLAVRQDFLRSSSRQVVAMSDLITTLLNLAKFDNGTIRMQRHVMPIGNILDRVFQNLEILADIQGVKLESSGDLSAQVKLDPRWEAEALANIIKNCIEHSPSGSVVTVRVEDSVLFTRVIIRDYGDGIAPRDLHHIFERFYKASTASSSNSQPLATSVTSSSLLTPAITSVGIGLSFAKSIIEADHGQIRVKSTQAPKTLESSVKTANKATTSTAAQTGTTFTVTYFH